MQPKGFQQTTGLDTEGHVNTPFRLYPQWSVGLCSSSSHRFSIHLDSRYMMTHPPIIHHHLNSTSQGLELAIGEPDLDHKLKTMIKVQFWMVSCYSQCHINHWVLWYFCLSPNYRRFDDMPCISGMSEGMVDGLKIEYRRPPTLYDIFSEWL